MAWWLILITLLCGLVIWIVKKLHFDHKDCQSLERLDGKIVVVTGCNQGIGYETVGELARRGARVIMACRDVDKAEKAKSKLLKRFGIPGSNKSSPHLTVLEESQLTCEKLDLDSPSSIRAFASRLRNQESHIDILINNAAVNFSLPRFDSSGLEVHLKINHLAHFLLTNLLHPLLTASPDGARVINVSSFNHRLAELNVGDLCHPSVGSCYSSSKLANVIHARQLSERWQDDGIVAVSVHPGLVKTELFKHMPITRWAVHSLLSWLAKSPLQGAQTIVYCAVTTDLTPGGYYSECRLSKVNPQALDNTVGEAVWTKSQELVKQWEDNEVVAL